MRGWVIIGSACVLATGGAAAQQVGGELATADSALAACIAAATQRTSAAAALAFRADTLWRRLARVLAPAAAPRVGLARVLLECRLPTAPAEEGDLFYDAELQLTTAIRDDGTYWPARYVLANALARAPEYLNLAHDAIAQLDTLLAPTGVPVDRPEHADALLLLGDLHRRIGHLEAAAATWRRGAEEHPDDARFRERLSDARPGGLEP